MAFISGRKKILQTQRQPLDFSETLFTGILNQFKQQQRFILFDFIFIEIQSFRNLEAVE